MSKLIFILGPSGVGKSTIVDLIRERHPEYYFVPSVSTRIMREGESQGNPYFFITKEEFETKIKDNRFLEWAEYSGEYYGTLIDLIQEGLSKYDIVYKILEMEGLKIALKTELKDQIHSIFLTPPSISNLKSRIIKRNRPMPEEEFANRIKVAEKEIEEAKVYCSKIILSEENEIDKIYREVEEEFEKVKGER